MRVFTHSFSPRYRTQASKSLGVRVELQNFTLHLSTLSVDLYGLTIHGATPYPDPPLLQVQHVQAGVSIVSVLRSTWYLDSFRVDRPVVQLFVDKNGVSNIPMLKSSSNGSNTSVFDLGIRHAVLRTERSTTTAGPLPLQAIFTMFSSMHRSTACSRNIPEHWRIPKGT